jgi:hypothetical protein
MILMRIFTSFSTTKINFLDGVLNTYVHFCRIGGHSETNLSRPQESSDLAGAVQTYVLVHVHWYYNILNFSPLKTSFHKGIQLWPLWTLNSLPGGEQTPVMKITVQYSPAHGPSPPPADRWSRCAINGFIT